MSICAPFYFTKQLNMHGEIRHICMAEDDPDDFFLFSKVLKETNNGVKLTWFQTCDALLKFLRNETDLPDLIILDMNMPRMDGHACLVTIKKEITLHHIPVIIFSTAGQPAHIEQAVKAGALKYILKPHSLDELRNVISEILKPHSP